MRALQMLTLLRT